MFEWQYRQEVDELRLDEKRMEEMIFAMKEEGKPMKTVKKTIRGAVVAAVLCAALVVSAGAAALLGAFDFLKKQEDFSALGMTDVYEKYAYDVGLTATTPGGDVFTLEKAATDGTFFTIFYSYRYKEPLMTREEFKALDAADPWTAYNAAPQMSILLDGKEISQEGYQNSFELQQYLADEHTVYGAWRCLLTTSFWETADGASLTLRGYTYDHGTEDKESFSLEFTSHPSTSVITTPGTEFYMNVASQKIKVEVDSFKNSPLGTLLTLRYERTQGTHLGLLGSFVLRDKDTGEYIPFARVWTRNNSGGTDEVLDTYELFGGAKKMNDMRHLELIPIRTGKSVSEKKVVSLSELPSNDAGNPAGGYAPASYRAQNNRLIVEMAPVGAASATYPALLNGVYFLDKDGNELFQHGSSTAKFKNRATGAITVVTTVEPEDFAANADKVDALWFFVQDYTLLEPQAVDVSLPGSVDIWD